MLLQAMNRERNSCKASLDQFGQVWTCLVQFWQVWTCFVKFGQDWTCLDQFGHAHLWLDLFEDMKNAAANNDYIERNSCRLFYTTNVDNHEFSLLYTMSQGRRIFFLGGRGQIVANQWTLSQPGSRGADYASQITKGRFFRNGCAENHPENEISKFRSV